MKVPGKDIITKLKMKYPIGQRVELVYMDDFQAPPMGTLGTVRGVDDMGSVLIVWDNGSSLSAVYDVDKIKSVK